MAAWRGAAASGNIWLRKKRNGSSSIAGWRQNQRISGAAAGNSAQRNLAAIGSGMAWRQRHGVWRWR